MEATTIITINGNRIGIVKDTIDFSSEITNITFQRFPTGITFFDNGNVIINYSECTFSGGITLISGETTEELTWENAKEVLNNHFKQGSVNPPTPDRSDEIMANDNANTQLILNAIAGKLPQPPTSGEIRVRYIMPSLQEFREPVYHIAWYNRGESISDYPPLPEITDNRLEFDTYTHTLDELQNLQSDIDVGVVLKTVDEKTHIDILANSFLGLTVKFVLQGVGIDLIIPSFRINYGDGTITDIVPRAETYSHTYSESGKYTVTIERINGNGTLNINSGGSNSMFLSVYLGNYTNLAASSFDNSSSLGSAVLPSSVTFMGLGIFRYCSSLRSVVIPTSVTTFGNTMFEYCRSLRTIAISPSVTNIGLTAFRYCHALDSAVIPRGVTSFGVSIFYDCYTLKSAVLPPIIPSIANNTFYNCYSLQSITIPSSVASLGNDVFFNCYSLEEIIFERETPPTISATTFREYKNIFKIYAPDDSVELYRTASNLLVFANYIRPISEKQ